MIEKFETFNESLTDQMTGKSDEEIELGIEKYIEQLKDPSDYTLPSSILSKIFDINGIVSSSEKINFIVENNLISSDEILDNIIVILDDYYEDDKDTNLPKYIKLLKNKKGN